MRIRSGKYLGECRPCACNGKSDTCDAASGKCLVLKFELLVIHCHFIYSSTFRIAGITLTGISATTVNLGII